MLSILLASLTVESFSLPQPNLFSPDNLLWKSSPGVQHFFKILYDYNFSRLQRICIAYIAYFMLKVAHIWTLAIPTLEIINDHYQDTFAITVTVV